MLGPLLRAVRFGSGGVRMSQPMAPSSVRFFTCISGLNQGKRFEIRDGEVLIGRSLEC